MKTSKLAQRLIDVSTELLTFDRLPNIRLISCCSDEVIMYGSGYSVDTAAPGLAKWAEHFEVPITITLSSMSGSVDVRFELAGNPCRLTSHISTDQAYAFGVTLQRPLTRDVPLELTAAELLAVVAGVSA